MYSSASSVGKIFGKRFYSLRPFVILVFLLSFIIAVDRLCIHLCSRNLETSSKTILNVIVWPLGMAGCQFSWKK